MPAEWRSRFTIEDHAVWSPEATADTRHAILDVVELLVDSGRWPAGMIGTVVEADDQLALIEISDDRGHGLDYVSVPHHALATRPDHPSAGVASIITTTS